MDFVGLLVYDGIRQYLRHQYCAASLMDSVNSSGKGLSAQVDHMELNYDLFLLIIIY